MSAQYKSTVHSQIQFVANTTKCSLTAVIQGNAGVFYVKSVKRTRRRIQKTMHAQNKYQMHFMKTAPKHFDWQFSGLSTEPTREECVSIPYDELLQSNIVLSATNSVSMLTTSANPGLSATRLIFGNDQQTQYRFRSRTREPQKAAVRQMILFRSKRFVRTAANGCIQITGQQQYVCSV